MVPQEPAAPPAAPADQEPPPRLTVDQVLQGLRPGLEGEECLVLRRLGVPPLLGQLCGDLLEDRPPREELFDWLRTWVLWKQSVCERDGLLPGEEAGESCAAAEPDELPVLPFHAVKLTGELGLGLYGRMYSATRKGPSRRGSLGGAAMVLEECIPLRQTDMKAAYRTRLERQAILELAAATRSICCSSLQRVVGFCESPHVLYVMSDAPGYANFVTWVRSLQLKDQRLTLRRLLRFAQRISEALAAVHGEGLVHGAITPGRVFCDSTDCDSFILWDPGMWAQWWFNRLPKLQADHEDTGIPPRRATLREQSLVSSLRRVRDPEALPEGEPTQAGDVWAFGLLLRAAVLYCPDDMPLQGHEDDNSAAGLIQKEGASLFPMPPGCPVEFWERIVAPCFAPRDARPSARQLVDAVQELTDGDLALQEGACSEWEALVVPFSEDRLSFVQYNVPAVRRGLALDMNTHASVRVNLSSVALHVDKSLGRALEEVGKAAALTDHCLELQMVYPEGRAGGRPAQGLLGFGRAAGATGGAAPSSPTLSGFDPDIPASAFRDAVDNLVRNTSLQCVALDALPLGEQGLEVLDDLVSQKASLRGLELANTPCGDAALAATLCASLRTRIVQGLTKVSLLGVGLGDAGVGALAEGLRRRACTLAHLHLGWNAVGPEGARALALALCENTSLLTLDLIRNNIGDAGAEELARMLYRNRTLRRADMQFNGLTVEGASSIIAALEVRPHISCYDTAGLLAFTPSANPTSSPERDRHV